MKIEKPRKYYPTHQAMPEYVEGKMYDIFWITPKKNLKLIYGVSWNPETNCFYDDYREYPYEEIKSWLWAKGFLNAKK